MMKGVRRHEILVPAIGTYLPKSTSASLIKLIYSILWINFSEYIPLS
jgi:hypothetical protein